MYCTIMIHNKIDGEGEAVEKALSKVNQYVLGAAYIDIYCRSRIPADAPAYKFPGWLEYNIKIRFDDGSKLHLAMIQRTMDSEFEFHS